MSKCERKVVRKFVVQTSYKHAHYGKLCPIQCPLSSSLDFTFYSTLHQSSNIHPTFKILHSQYLLKSQDLKWCSHRNA